jgi:hypothetical protein
MSQYDNVKSRLQNLDIKILNTKEDFNTTKIFQLECPKGHQTEQKNTSMINRLSAYSNKKCTNICGTCCNEDGILQKILPVMQAKRFELVELKDDHLNIIYKCVCGNIASSNTKNIKKSTCCAKCLNHHRNFTSLCENAKEAGFEIEMSFKEYLEDHASIKMKHLTCQQEIIKSFGINMHFVCKVCSKAKKEEQKVEIVLEQQNVKESNEFKYGYKCCVEDCQYYAIYLGTLQPLYCDMHYPNEGPKVMFAGYKLRICIEEDCDRRAVFNYENGMNQIFCQTHMQPNMINVASVKCIECQTNTARYNFKIDWPKVKYCKVCRDKKTDKEDIVDCCEKLCNPPDCWRQAIFGYTRANKKEWKCKDHKKDDMVDVKNEKCKTPLCITSVSTKYKGYCLFCFIHMFPNEQVTRNYKTKEIYVRDFILKYFPQSKYSWLIDSKISDGCSKRRPDLLLDLGYQILIVEIDENQHLGYDCLCENKRIMEISRDLSHRPVIFIRFNPDDYININGEQVKSCWKINSKGICVIYIQKELDYRLQILKNQIEYWLNESNKTEKIVEIINICYDE